MHYPAVIASVDAIFNLTGLLLRTGAYTLLGNVLGVSESGIMILAGIFVGDALASVIHIFWHQSVNIGQTIGELLLLTILYAWMASDTTWPNVFIKDSILFWMPLIIMTCLRIKHGMMKEAQADGCGWA